MKSIDLCKAYYRHNSSALFDSISLLASYHVTGVTGIADLPSIIKFTHTHPVNSMKHIFPLGLLAFLVLGCSSVSSTASTEKVNAVETSIPKPIAQSTSKPETTERPPTPTSQNVYPSARFRFWFEYPSGYVVDPSNENRRPKLNETLQGTIDIWKSADYEAIKSRSFQGGELPPNMSINVHSNPNQRPLSYWKDTLSIGSRDARAITVGGQNAVAYTSTGQYEFDNVLLSSPDGRRVIHLNVGYIDKSDPSRQAFQRVVSSFKFES